MAQRVFRETLEQIPLCEGPHTPPTAEESAGRLFTVTFISGHEMMGGTRTVAICDTWAQAVSMVTDSGEFFHETTYHLAVVETCWPNQGYGGMDRVSWWFRWVPHPNPLPGADTGAYHPCQVPPSYRMVQGFGIG